MRLVIGLSLVSAALLAATVSRAQPITCLVTDTACRVQHNDAAILGKKLDDLLDQLKKAPLATVAPSASSSSAGAATASSTAPIASSTDATYFPVDPGNAAFPSPENSRQIRTATGISGRPYLIDKNGSVHTLVPATAAVPQGYTVNGARAGGGGDVNDLSSIYMLMIERQGQVYVQRAGGQWQWFNPGMGGNYNAGSLPDAFQTDASGATTSTIAVSSVKAPTPAPRAAIAPGSSGKVLKVCATGCAYTTLTAAIQASVAGDTVDLGAGTYKEAPPAIAVPLKIIWEQGAILDGTGLTGSLAHGKGLIIPMSDLLLVNPVITGTAMDQGSAQGTAAIRPETGCNYIDIQGGELYGNQNGIAGGDIPVVLTVTGTSLHDNGLGDGYTHNIYMSGGTLSVTLNNVNSVNPNGGHAAKVRAYALTINGGTFEAFSAAAIDDPQGSVGVALIDGATIIKKAGAYNHTVLDYATENNNSGNGGMTIRNTTFNLLCDNPVIMVGAGSVVTLEGSNKFIGTKPTANGGKVAGL